MSTEATRRIIDKIKALRAKTTDAGATEAEAASAAAMAQRLMAQYQIDAGDVAAGDYERFLVAFRGINIREPSKSHPFTIVSDGVAHITGTRCWFTRGGIFICGDEPGREMAAYLFDMSRNVCDAAWRREAEARIARLDGILTRGGAEKSTPAMRRKAEFATLLRDKGLATDFRARRSFLIGMASRLRKRMLAMPSVRAIPEDAALRLMADKTMKPERENERGRKIDERALLAGVIAGRDAPISMGVGATAAPLMIGKAST